MKLDVSETALDGYRLERVTENEPPFITVYEASVSATSERVAVRAFPIPTERRLRRDFRRAAKQRAAGSHEGLLPAQAALEHDGRLYLVTELSSAPTLASRLERGPLNPETAVPVLARVAQALDEVDWIADGILSPASILLQGSDESRAVLADPAKAVSLREVGWPWVHPHFHYSSPEMGRGEHVGARSTVYSLGCILFECLSGSRPFEGDWIALLEAHSTGPIPAVSKRRPELGTAFDSVIARAMAKDPGDRFATAGELVRAAETALRAGETGAAQPSPAPDAHQDVIGSPPLADPEPTVESEPFPERESVLEETPSAEPVRAATGSQSVLGGAPTRSRPVDPADEVGHRGRKIPSRPTGRAGASRRDRPVVLACGLGACALAGYLVGTAATPEPEPANAAGAGSLSLQLPADWQRRSAAGALPGTKLQTAIAAGPRVARGAGLVAGRTDATGKDVLPAGLTAARRSAAEPVRLGRFDAYRHRGLRAAGSRREVTAYSIPTADGAAVLACHAASPAPSKFMQSCERVASTVDLRDLRAIPLRVLDAERRRLAETVTQLRGRRLTGRRRLSAANNPARQAREARRLEAAYRDARASLAKLDAAAQPAGRQARLVTAVRRIEVAYGGLARAAADQSSGGYNAASRSVSRSEAALARLLAQGGRGG